jgi:hypothetical protein
MAFLDTLRKGFAAIAFAEAGEFDTAGEIAYSGTASVKDPGKLFRMFENYAVAAAFAEEGLPKEAMQIVEPLWRPAPSGKNFLELVGLQHAVVHVYVTTH